MEKDELIESEMYRRAIEFIPQRYPRGYGGVAIVHTADDRYLISVAIESANDSVIICIETGAIAEAHKYGTKVTHCLCVVRDNESSPFKILSPCGVCQERLRYWGTDVKVGVITPDRSILFVALNELQPYHWTNAFPPEELESFGNPGFSNK